MNIISCLPTINTPSGLAYLMVSSAHFPGKSKAKDSGRESIAAVGGGGVREGPGGKGTGTVPLEDSGPGSELPRPACACVFEHCMCTCKHTNTTCLALFFQPQMFFVANSHKMTLFRQFFPCCYLISFLTNYSKLFTFLIPEVISVSAGGSHPAHYHRLTLQAGRSSCREVHPQP